MTRILITAVVGCVLSGVIGYLLLPVLRALKAGQSIREIGPTWHNYKAGTPMMGGLMFVAAALICLLCNIPFMSDYSVLYVFAISLCFTSWKKNRMVTSFSSGGRLSRAIWTSSRRSSGGISQTGSSGSSSMDSSCGFR